MAVNCRSWGVLGSPSKEKIEEYKNMPVGSFKNMVKNLSRGKKGKVMSEHIVYVSKRKTDLTRGVIKVDAFEFNDAANLARERIEQVVWDNEPYVTNKEDFVFASIDPLKYRY